tara:strand:- start:1879 stop:2202 length:324 start_codon:yes stop_codon:yes gene_type:complete
MKLQELLPVTEVSGKVKRFKQKLMRRGIKIRYDRAAAEKDLQTKYGGKGQVVGKKFGLRKAYYATPQGGSGASKSRPQLTINKQEMDQLHSNGKIQKGNVDIIYKDE